MPVVFYAPSAFLDRSFLFLTLASLYEGQLKFHADGVEGPGFSWQTKVLNTRCLRRSRTAIRVVSDVAVVTISIFGGHGLCALLFSSLLSFEPSAITQPVRPILLALSVIPGVSTIHSLTFN